MLNTGELADAVIINSTTINGIWDNDYLEALDIAGTSPAFTCDADDLAAIIPAVARGTTLTRASVNYTITNIKPDNNGFKTLIVTEN